VFFTYNHGGHLTAMRGLPLNDQVANVARLAEQWDFSSAFDGDVPDTSPERRNWLVRAAKRHDLGKPRRFKIVPADKNQDQRFTYSFAGHRFDVEDDHPYVQQLIRLHHSFSVSDVTEAQSLLKHDRAHPDVAAAARLFPLDLYALEMCDQIEAEATTHAFSAPEERQRVFMEFQLYPEASKLANSPMRLHVFPYPFGEVEVPLTFESFVVRVPQGASQDGDALKKLLLDGPVERQKPCEVVLCPLP
jgi:CRISPR-associated endonuclease/helicase Cas3